MKTSRVLILTLYGLLCAAIFTKAQPSANMSRLDSLFNALETNNRAMCAVEFAKNGKILYHREIGEERFSPRTPTTSKTEYRIGSISKMYTAVMILQLIEEHKLSLRTRLATFFPQIAHADSITIEQMLRHRSGIYDVKDDSTFPTWMREHKSEDEMLSIIASETPSFNPGMKFQYCNSNYILLGYIVERITGYTYMEELRTRITNRLGLHHTYYGGTIGSKPHEAVPYEYEDSVWNVGSQTDMSIPGGAGAIVSTPDDLIKFIDALFHEKLVSRNTLASMEEMGDNFGMGMMRSTFGKRYSLGHRGGIDDFVSNARFFPDDSIEWVILGNGWRTDMSTISNGALSIFYDTPYSIPSFHYITLTAKQLEDYVGMYSSPLGQIVVRREGNHLTAQPTGESAFALDAIDNAHFEFVADNVEITFRCDDKGIVQDFLLNRRGRHETFKKD